MADLPSKIEVRQSLFNEKLRSETGPDAGRSVVVKDPEAVFGYHYLVVHVKNGEVADVSPRFIDPAELSRSLFRPQVTLASTYYSSPGSAGASLEFSPGFWGLERIYHYLEFVNWRPSVTLGFVHYNVWKKSPDVQINAASLEISPFVLECHLPRANIVTLRLLGFEWWGGRRDLRRGFLTTGLEMPLFYNLFGSAERLSLGVKFYFPLGAGPSMDPSFGKKVHVAFTVGYRFRL